MTILVRFWTNEIIIIIIAYCNLIRKFLIYYLQIDIRHFIIKISLDIGGVNA